MANLPDRVWSGGPVRTRPVDPTIDLPGLGETLWRHRWIILAFVVLFAALGFVGLKMISPRYTATASIFIDPRPQRVLQNEVVQQNLGDNMALVDSQIEVIKSASVLSRVVKKFDLVKDPEFVPQSGKKGKGSPSEIALAGLSKATDVTRPDNTYVINISVTTKDAAKSAKLANAVVAAYITDQASSDADITRDVSSAIQDRLATLQKKLQLSEEKVAAFKRDHDISQADGKLLADQRLSALSNRQADAIDQVNQAKTRLQIMEDSLRKRGYVDPATTTGSSDIMGTLLVRLSDAKQRLAQLQQQFGSRYPGVSTAASDVAQAQDAIRSESKRLISSARDNYSGAVDTLNKVDAELKKAQATSFATNDNLITLSQLETEASANKDVYQAFLVRAKQTAQQEDITPRTARVIAEASAPASPSFPPRLPLLAASGLLGLFAGVLVSLLHGLTGGRRARDSRQVALLPKAARVEALSGLMVVTTLGNGQKAREIAIRLAEAGLTRHRSVIFVDLAEDAPTSLPGLADIASGEALVSDAVHINRDSGLHTLYAGRIAAKSAASRRIMRVVFEEIVDEYDDVVVNMGELNGEHGTPARAVTDLTRQIVLVVEGDGPDARERRMVEAFSNDEDVVISFISAGAETADAEAA